MSNGFGKQNNFKSSFFLLLAFTIVLFLRPQEIYHQLSFLPLQKILAVPILISVLLNLRFIVWNNFHSSVLKWFGLYLLMIFFSIPFSLWPGGSVEFIANFIVKEIIIICILIIVISSWQELRKITLSIGFCYSIVAILTIKSFIGAELLVGGYRAALSQGVFSDPNDLASNFVFALPFLYFMGLNVSRKRILYASAIFCVILGTLVTYSRGGMIGLLSVCVSILVFDKVKRKRNLVLLVVGIISIFIMSPNVVTRMETLVSPDKESVGSLQARAETLKSGIKIFSENPILGVGVHSFGIAEGATHGGVGKWNAAHNMFLQIASETGILGLIGFIGCIISSLKVLTNISKDAGTTFQIKTAATALKSSLWGFLICGMFLSHAYSWNFFYLTGLTVSLENIYRNSTPIEEKS